MSNLSHQLRRRARRGALETACKALREIAAQDITELLLDPDWPRRIARHALDEINGILEEQ